MAISLDHSERFPPAKLHQLLDARAILYVPACPRVPQIVPSAPRHAGGGRRLVPRLARSFEHGLTAPRKDKRLMLSSLQCSSSAAAGSRMMSSVTACSWIGFQTTNPGACATSLPIESSAVTT